MNWMDQVKQNLLPLSRDRTNVQKALKEWLYTGITYDLDQPVETCALCGYNPIRYQFEIENQYTGNDLLIGSECINRFGISGIDEYGDVLDAEETRKKVGRDRQKLISDAKTRRMINTLVKLAAAEEASGDGTEFKIQNFIGYFHERGAFTPSQLNLLLWRLGKHRISYHPTDFKLTIKRDREKAQLLRMEEFKMKALWKCMSNSQQVWYAKHKDTSAWN